MSIIKSISKKIDADNHYINEYHITHSENDVDDIGKISLYGIMIKSNICDEVYHIKDISSKLEYVEKLFQMIVDLNVSPIHLYDVVEDFLCGYQK